MTRVRLATYEPSVNAVLTAGASSGTVACEKVGTTVTARVSITKASTVEHVATIPAGMQPPHNSAHCWLQDASGGWWPVVATTTQILVLGPPPAGTVLSGSMTWRTV